MTQALICVYCPNIVACFKMASIPSGGDTALLLSLADCGSVTRMQPPPQRHQQPPSFLRKPQAPKVRLQFMSYDHGKQLEAKCLATRGKDFCCASHNAVKLYTIMCVAFGQAGQMLTNSSRTELQCFWCHKAVTFLSARSWQNLLSRGHVCCSLPKPAKHEMLQFLVAN